MPVSWQIAPSHAAARSMFCAMIVMAWPARVSAGSAVRATFMAARTSGGRSVDVRTISCRTLSKKSGSMAWICQYKRLRPCRPFDTLRVVSSGVEGRAEDEMPPKYRTERDPLGELPVPADAYYGIQTARAVENFPIS